MTDSVDDQHSLQSPVTPSRDGTVRAAASSAEITPAAKQFDPVSRPVIRLVARRLYDTNDGEIDCLSNSDVVSPLSLECKVHFFVCLLLAVNRCYSLHL
jgi:hypothetical protein